MADEASHQVGCRRCAMRLKSRDIARRSACRDGRARPLERQSQRLYALDPKKSPGLSKITKVAPFNIDAVDNTSKGLIMMLARWSGCC
jgi:hypothetical protein